MASIDIAQLAPDERLDLIEELWDSLSATPEAVPMTTAQREELDRRIDDMDPDRSGGIPWEEVLRDIRSLK